MKHKSLGHQLRRRSECKVTLHKRCQFAYNTANMKLIIFHAIEHSSIVNAHDLYTNCLPVKSVSHSLPSYYNGYTQRRSVAAPAAAGTLAIISNLR